MTWRIFLCQKRISNPIVHITKMNYHNKKVVRDMVRLLMPCSRLMFLIGKVISSMLIVLLSKSSTIPNSFMVSLPRMRSYWGLLFLLFDHIGFWIVPFAIRVIKEVQLYPSFTLSLEDPIWSIPRLWNQPFQVEKQHGLVFINKD